MIKLAYNTKPKELTEELQKQLTEEFKKDKKKTVWNKPFIRKALLTESNRKCAYCECYIGEGHKEMHVDHFHYKDVYEDEVVQWENLVPSCPHCNKRKSTHDTYLTPIINPFIHNPQDYFYIKNYRYCSRNKAVEKIVKDTIGVLGLNDTDDSVKLRFAIGEALLDEIQNIYELAKDNELNLISNTQKRNRVLNGCKNILKKGIKTAEYSAFMATLIQSDDDFNNLIVLLQKLNLWNNELELLDLESKSIVLKTYSDETKLVTI